MTAAVAIMNTMGIAMAADSAVTLGVGKTYNTADKLFALSKYRPVGIMIYSSAAMMGIEWETIIKSYRDFWGQKSFDTLPEYAGDFINYLTKFPYFTDEQMVDYLKSVCKDVFNHVLDWFWDDLHKEFDGKENTSQDQIDTVLNASLKAIKNYIDDTIDNAYISPIMDIVSCMQKSELAAMAEAMVNLTALKRHVTTDSKTVGGPVDVAIISKGDGFVWIKRKTNYDPTINMSLRQSFFHGGEK
jgi:hypothetical protein